MSIKHAVEDGAPFAADSEYRMDITIPAEELPNASIGGYKHKGLLIGIFSNAKTIELYA